MSIVERLGQPHELTAVLNGPIQQPEISVSYPHLQAWLGVVGNSKTRVPNALYKDKILNKEGVYRKLEAETTKQIAGFFAVSAAIIVGRLGVPIVTEPDLAIRNDERRINEPFSEKLYSFIEAAQGDSENGDKVTRKVAEKFIEESLNFISDLPSLKDNPELVMLAVSDYMCGYYQHLNTDNNLSIPGGMALFGLALPKRAFNGYKDVRAKLIETVKKDYTAWKIYRAFEKDLFSGKAYQPEDKDTDLAGTYL